MASSFTFFSLRLVVDSLSLSAKMFGKAPKKSDSTEYYEILGVSKNGSQDDLKKAHRKAAIKNHPGKGGDPEKFKEFAQAYVAPPPLLLPMVPAQEIIVTLSQMLLRC